MNATSGFSLDKELSLATTADDARLDTRLLAQHLDNQHKSIFELLTRHQTDFEMLGKVPFQTEALPSGQSERFATLNEDQCFLMLTFSRNTEVVRALKVKLIMAFCEARRARDLLRREYLPAYHELHDRMQKLAVGSENKALVHSNLNKLLNKAAGIEAGQRATASLPTQSLLVVAQLLASKAMLNATDHRAGYILAKSALQPLMALTAIPNQLGLNNG